MKRLFLPLLIAALVFAVVPVIAQDDIPPTSAIIVATNTPVTVIDEQPAADPVVDDVPPPLPDVSLTDLQTWFEGAVLALIGSFTTSTIAVVITSFLMSLFKLTDTARKPLSLGVGAVLYILALLVAHFGLRDQFHAVLNSLIVILPALTTLIGTFTLQPVIGQQFANAAAKYEYMNQNARARAQTHASALRAASVPDTSQYVRRDDLRSEMTRFREEVVGEMRRLLSEIAVG